VDLGPQERVERTLARIARHGVLGDGLIEDISGADQRRPYRNMAERLAEQSGRGDLVRDARARIRAGLDEGYGDLALGNMFGSPGDPAAGAERAATAIALGDLVLAAAVEDLLAPAVFRTLSQDGEAILGMMASPTTAYPRAGVEVGGTIDPVASPWAGAQLVAGILAAIFIGPVAFLFGWDRYGTAVGLTLGLLVAGVCLAWAVWPRRRRIPGIRAHGLTNRSGR
jgi:hypothetical protein